MDIKFYCGSCSAKMGADDQYAGQSVSCPKCGTRATVPIPPIEHGTEIGGYVVQKELGKGAMGTVYLARHEAMDRNVALKVLSTTLGNDDEYTARFHKEVRFLGRLSHPNIITAYEAGEQMGYHYLTMAYVEGEDLDARVEREGALPEKEALRIAAKMAKALNYAWDEMQMLHRDLKPENIMVDDHDGVFLMDLGISKQAQDDKTLTMTGMAVGTPTYMSPEQARGDRDLDCRTDIYGLGAALYQLVTGTEPYQGKSTMHVLTQVLSQPHRPVQEVNPDVSDDTVILIDRMMEKEPEDRYQSWEEVRHDIKLIRTGKHLQPPPRSARTHRKEATHSHGDKETPLRWILVLVLIVLVLVLTGVLLALSHT